ncbi:MAG: gliding motility protein GldL [Bergeyella sp.]|nr:gliding motility protein GldL [Bergeyella sp.]
MFKTKDAKLNFVYSMGGAIVILGAFFKMTHTTFGGLVNPTYILGAGLIIEVVIFTIYAFNPPKEEKHYRWENLYPELLGEEKSYGDNRPIKLEPSNLKEANVTLSDKLDNILSEAKLDVSLFERLKSGIDKFSASVEQINQAIDVSASTGKYNEELNKAATHMQRINALYEMQLESNKISSEYQAKYIEDLRNSMEQSAKFNEELKDLTSNLSNLNRVYGGMLSAMKS